MQGISTVQHTSSAVPQIYLRYYNRRNSRRIAFTRSCSIYPLPLQVALALGETKDEQKEEAHGKRVSDRFSDNRGRILVALGLGTDRLGLGAIGNGNERVVLIVQVVEGKEGRKLSRAVKE